MFSPSLIAVRRRPLRGSALLCAVLITLTACGSQTSSPTPLSSRAANASQPGTASPGTSASAAPTAVPTPQYTNPDDPELTALIPERIGGVQVHVPDRSQFAFTPGDFAAAYGDLGLRFRSLQVAYVEDPRLSLYVARIGDPVPSTRDLEPYLATAAQYVGIAGLHREPWRYRRVEGRVAWVRPEDNATVAGTMIYTWAAEDYVFLMIGVDDHLNRDLFSALPGEVAPAATPRPSATASVRPSASSGASSAP